MSQTQAAAFCRHHWMIDSVGFAVCKHCRAERQFPRTNLHLMGSHDPSERYYGPPGFPSKVAEEEAEE